MHKTTLGGLRYIYCHILPCYSEQISLYFTKHKVDVYSNKLGPIIVFLFELTTKC